MLPFGSTVLGSAPGVVDRLSRYGRNLGLAFQIADDLLDLTGNECCTGKSLGTDLKQQKLTLPLIRLLEKAPPDSGVRVRQILGSPGNHKLEACRPFFADSDALHYAGRRAEEFAALARTDLACLPPSRCRSILELLTDRVVHRSS